MKWVADNRAAYAGQYVSVERDRLIAADKDGLKVYNAAKAEGIESPFLVWVEPYDPRPFFPGCL